MDINKNCCASNIKLDKDNYKKDRTVCKKCYNKKKRKNNNTTIIENDICTSQRKPKIRKNNSKNVLAHENHAYVVIGPRNISKTYYMLKKLEKKGNKRPIHIITRSPNQYPNYKTSTEIKLINKYRVSSVIFDDMLGARNFSQKVEFLTRGRHEDLDVCYISQSYFGLPRQSIRNNSDRLVLFKQTLRDVQNMHYDIGAYDMKYDEFKKCVKSYGVKVSTIFVLI